MWTTTAQFGTGVQGTPAQAGAQAGTAQTGMWAQGPTTTPSNTGAPATTRGSGAQAGPGAPTQPSPWPQPGAGAGPKPQGPSRMGPQATTAPPETGARGATTPKAPSSTGTQPDAKAQTNANEARPSASTEDQPSPWRPAPKTRSNALTQERKAHSSLSASTSESDADSHDMQERKAPWRPAPKTPMSARAWGTQAQPGADAGQKAQPQPSPWAQAGTDTGPKTEAQARPWAQPGASAQAPSSLSPHTSTTQHSGTDDQAIAAPKAEPDTGTQDAQTHANEWMSTPIARPGSKARDTQAQPPTAAQSSISPTGAQTRPGAGAQAAQTPTMKLSQDSPTPDQATPFGTPTQSTWQPTSSLPDQAMPTSMPSKDTNAQTRKRGRGSLLVAALALVAVIAAVWFFVLPAISGTAANAKISQVLTGSGDVSAVLPNAICKNVSGNQPMYFSNEAMAQFITNKANGLERQAPKDLDGLLQLSDQELDQLNGQWALANFDYRSSSSSTLSASSTGIVAYMTVVKTSGLTSQQLVDTIQKSGLDFDHAGAVGLTAIDLQRFIDSTSKTSSSSNERELGLNSAIENYKISSYTKAKGFHTASFMGRASMGWAVSIEYDNYSIIVLLSGTPEAIQESSDLKGFADLYNSMQSDYYVR